MIGNKLHDVKIPVSEELNVRLMREGMEREGSSKTAFATEVFMFSLDNIQNYKEVLYEGDFMIHITITHEIYLKVVELAVGWRCSIRKAVHRVFMSGAYEQGLMNINDFVRE